MDAVKKSIPRASNAIARQFRRANFDVFILALSTIYYKLSHVSIYLLRCPFFVLILITLISILVAPTLMLFVLLSAAAGSFIQRTTTIKPRYLAGEDRIWS